MTDHTTQSSDKFLLFYKDDPARSSDQRWCGVVVQVGGADGEVLDATFKPSDEELHRWFDGWQAGWHARTFHIDRPSVREREARHD